MLRRSIYKTPAQLRAMIEPGLITAAALDAARSLIAPGITTAQLDAAASDAITSRGAVSNFQMVRGYRHTICTSVNDQVVHGIPGERVLEPGDIVSVDAGAEFRGWNGDSAFSLVLPDASRPDVVAERQRLSDVTEGSLWAGIAALASAKRIGEIGSAIQAYIDDNAPEGGYGILRDYVGHGIGRKMHESPSVFNYRVSDPGPEVRPGLVLAIEPMVVIGDQATYVEDDDWTVSTVDGTAGSHWEHSVAVHDEGIWVLTAHDGGAAGLAPFGIVPDPSAEAGEEDMAQAQARKPNWFAIWISVGVVVALVLVSVLVIWMNNAANAPGPRPEGSGIDAETGAIVAGSGSNEIDIWFDFYCPHCQDFEEAYGPTVDDLLEQGDITLNLLPVALPSLNSASGTDFSKRSANALYCIAETSPDAAYPFMQALFATNPSGPGQTDEELIAMATEAGAADISSCVADGTYISFVEDQTVKIPENPTSGGAGTPTVLVNGEYITLTGDPQVDLVDRMN